MVRSTLAGRGVSGQSAGLHAAGAADVEVGGSAVAADLFLILRSCTLERAARRKVAPRGDSR